MISAAVIRALDGDMQARLIPATRSRVTAPRFAPWVNREIARCEELGIDVSKVLKLEDLAKNDNVIFSATGITKG